MKSRFAMFGHACLCVLTLGPKTVNISKVLSPVMKIEEVKVGF